MIVDKNRHRKDGKNQLEILERGRLGYNKIGDRNEGKNPWRNFSSNRNRTDI